MKMRNNQSEKNGQNQSDPNTSQPINQEIEELLAAFALGATDRDESAAIQRLLATQPELAAELADYSELADKLLFAAPPVDVPTGLEGRIQAAIRTPVVDAHPKDIRTFREPAIPWWKRIQVPQWSLQLGMGLVVVLLLVLINGYWSRQVAILRQTQQALESELLLHKTTFSVIAMDDSERIMLTPTNPLEHFDADLIWGEGFETALLYVADFPSVEPGKTYQSWLLQGKEYISAGTLTISEFGAGTLIIQLAKPFDEYDGVTITIEPEGGSAQPTTQPIAQGFTKDSVSAQ